MTLTDRSPQETAMRDYIAGMLRHERECPSDSRYPPSVRKPCTCIVADILKAWNEREAALAAVAQWDIRWAEGLDSNVEEIKNLVRRTLEGE